jgi:hypothetical protein
MVGPVGGPNFGIGKGGPEFDGSSSVGAGCSDISKLEFATRCQNHS